MVLQAYVAGSIVGHIDKLRFSGRQRLGEHPNIAVPGINNQVLDRFNDFAVLVFVGNHLGARYLKLVSLAAHGLNQYREMQFTTTRYNKLVWSIAIHDPQTTH